MKPNRRSWLGSRMLAVLSLAAVLGGGSGMRAPAMAQEDSDAGYLGVMLQDLNDDLRESYGYRGDGGVLIGQVESGSPAAHAGLRRGDILLRFKGRRVDSAGDATEAVRDQSAGDRVSLTIWRSGSERTVSVTLGSRPSGPEAPAPPEMRDEPEGPGPRIESRQPGDDDVKDRDDDDIKDRGDHDEDDTPIRPDDDREIRRHVEMMMSRPRLGVEIEDVRSGNGVRVTRVIEDGAADKAGIRTGDVIVAVDGRDVDDSSELRRELARQDKGPVRITVQRNGRRQILTAQLEERGRGFAMGPYPGMRMRTFNMPAP